MAEAKTEEFEEKQQQPKEETTKPLENKEALWTELEKLQGEWRKVLEQGAALGYPHMVKLTQDGQTEYFYVLKNLARQTDQETSTFKFRAIRSDMKIYDIEQKVRLMSFGPIVAAIEFREVDRGELDPTSLYQLVKEVVSGSTPL